MDLKVSDFSLDSTLSSGQTFFWRKSGDYWFTSLDKPIKVRQVGDKLEYEGCSEHELRMRLGLGDDILSIKTELDKDDFLDKAVRYSDGLRVIDDGLWPATLGFILSIQSNVPLIQRRLLKMSEKYGKPENISGTDLRSFPDYVKIYEDGMEVLKGFNLGFRTKFVMSAAENFYKHDLDRSLPVEDLKKRLLGINGVGEKVLDCIMLYGLHDLSAFPMDVWILRVLSKHYGHIIKDAKSYRSKRDAMTDYFGAYAGYAQLFIYNYSRSNSIK